MFASLDYTADIKTNDKPDSLWYVAQSTEYKEVNRREKTFTVVPAVSEIITVTTLVYGSET